MGYKYSGPNGPETRNGFVMKIFNSRKTKIRLASLFAALTIVTIGFSFPTESESIHQDPTVTSKQIEALPRSTSTAQSPADRVALYQALLDLTNPWTVMCIAAHPDDEDGTSLIVMRRKYGAHTVSLFSTFGEGGQNAIGPELYEELGAIRARETMAAAEIQGSEPHFLGLKDFGYSKSADEAFKFWGHDEALRRMVLEIRRLRPDVIITNHSVTTNDHGHHQATARLELEAFDAAADPKRFAEQLKDGVTTWQVQRLFVRARGNAAQNPNPQGAAEQIVTIDPNERDPIRGVVYAEEALRGLQKHATQGPWPKTFAEFAARFRAFSGQSAAPGQMPLIRYRLVREATGVQTLPKDSHSFVDGMRLPEIAATRLAPPTIDGRSLMDAVDARDKVLRALLAADKPEDDDQISNERHVSLMRRRLFHALSLASGVAVRIRPADKVLVPGDTSKFEITISNGGPLSALPYLMAFNGSASGVGANTAGPLLPGKSITVIREFRTPPDETTTVPNYKHLYDGAVFGKQISATAYVNIEGAGFMVPANVFMDVAPRVEIAHAVPNPFVIRQDYDKTYRSEPALTFLLVNNSNTTFRGQLSVKLNYGSDRLQVNLLPLGHETVTMTARRLLSNFTGNRTPPDWISLSVLNSPSTIATEKIPLVFVNAQVAASTRVGYIRGFDFSLPNALAALGVESKELSVDEVKTADLQKYTSIIVDNRVYESQPELIAANQKLLDYANAGGTLIVFYHKSDEWNPDERRKRPQLAPYKLILGNERITDETAPITFIEPEHPLLSFPNKLDQEDFANWIQERGLYYPKDWDPQFHALLKSNDPGEAPLKGGLLVADYGRGHYIYTSMVWYRELRGGVPGAYRMLANMISYGQAEGKGKK